MGLVREDGQAKPGGPQGLQSVRDAGIELRFVDEMRVVFATVTPESFIQIHPRCIGKSPRHQHPGTIADHMDDGAAGKRFQAEGYAHAVDGGTDIPGGVDQGAVHVECDDGIHGRALSNQIGMVWFRGRRACASSPGCAVTPRFQ